MNSYRKLIPNQAHNLNDLVKNKKEAPNASLILFTLRLNAEAGFGLSNNLYEGKLIKYGNIR
ncbi:hypothetical protein NTGHW29_140016 [Candidatus Nitrotoga sp. HW29]|nr:hypothetical protein NTGHW29_140016 [Candidatus Nitrotoga sp. HW29]